MTPGLIERLEAAGEGSRELDGAVWYAVHEPDVEHGCLHVEQTEQGPVEVLTCELGSKYADHVAVVQQLHDAGLDIHVTNDRTTSSVEENLIAVKQAHLDAQARRPFPSGGNDSTD